MVDHNKSASWVPQNGWKAMASYSCKHHHVLSMHYASRLDQISNFWDFKVDIKGCIHPHFPYIFPTKCVVKYKPANLFWNLKVVQGNILGINYLFASHKVQSRRLDLATGTFLWPEQGCKILCIFCYFRLPWGNRNVPLARATLPIPLYFWQL